MKLPTTQRPLRAHLKLAVKQMVRRACEDLGVSLSSVSDNLEEIARALADGRITSVEVTGVRKRISELENECAQLRRSLSHMSAS